MRESKAKLEAALDSMTDAIFISDVEGRFIDFNDAFATFHKFRDKGECAKTLAEYPRLLDVFESDGKPVPLEMWAVSRALRGDTVTNAEYTLRRKDTGETWVGSFSFGPILDQDGVIVGSVVVGRDITKRKLSEEVLKKSEEELRFLSSRLLSAQEEERKRIAGELHDGLSGTLIAVKLGVENAQKRLEDGDAEPEMLDAPIAWIQYALEEARRMMLDLRPSMLDRIGLVATIDWFCREFLTTYSNIHVEKEIRIEEEEIPEELKIVIFRIMQEAFHNLAKYSKTEYVNLSLVNGNAAIELTIEDNGEGFDLEAVLSKSAESKGLGLTSMKERAELSGGIFSLVSTPGEGTIVRASWPIESQFI